MNALNVLPKVLPFLYVGKGQRLCDVRLYFPEYSEDQVVEALEASVDSGEVVKHLLNEENFYFKKA